MGKIIWVEMSKCVADLPTNQLIGESARDAYASKNSINKGSAPFSFHENDPWLKSNYETS